MKRKERLIRERHRTPSKFEHVIFAAFFLSGLAGLMHEVVWAKLLVPLIGAAAHAQAAVLAVFMGGLAIGAVLIGRLSDRIDRPLRIYVILELLIGIYGLLLPLLVQAGALGYVSLATHFFESAGIKILLRFALAIAVVLLPAILMGGTLPLLARHLIGRVTETRRQVARLYGLNSLGAVVGAGIAGFVTLPLFGVYVSLVLASVLNLAAGALVLRPAAREAASAGAAQQRDKRSKGAKKRKDSTASYRPAQYVVTLVALALSGFAAMGYEVLFTRIIALSFGSSAYSFTVMLMSFITGIALGSLVISRLKVKRPLWVLAVSQLAVVVALLAATPLVSRLPYEIGLLRIGMQNNPFGFELYQLGKALRICAVLLLPTMCLGFSFPLVAQIQARHPHQIGARVGSTYAWNTLGNVFGVMVTSLLLLPWLGLLGGFHFNLALNFIAGLALLVVAREVEGKRRVFAGAAAAFAVVVYLAVGTGWPDTVNFATNHLRLRLGPDPALGLKDRLSHPASSFESWKQVFVARETESKFFDEDSHATVLVAEKFGDRLLFINSKPDASSLRDLDTQILIAHAPLFLKPQAKTLLVIGHGAGVTAGSALRHPIERVDIVEISRAVLNADPFFAQANYGVLADARTRVHVDDGQSFLRTVPRGYDVIISEPTNPWIAGVGGLFTVEFFELARSRLNPGGVFTVWIQAYEQNDAGVELVCRTLGSVFPHVMVFGDNDLSNLVAVASMSPIEPDFGQMEQRFGDPAVRVDLARMGISNLPGLLSHHRVSQGRFPTLVGPGPLNTVGHERLEYATPRSMFKGEDSMFFDRSDPLIQGVDLDSDILLDRYIAYRLAVGRPMSRQDFEETARYTETMLGYGSEVSKAIMARAERADTR